MFYYFPFKKYNIKKILAHFFYLKFNKGNKSGGSQGTLQTGHELENCPLSALSLIHLAIQCQQYT